jgi:hypothetical protein
MSERMAAALKGQRVEHRLYRMEGFNHMFDVFPDGLPPEGNRLACNIQKSPRRSKWCSPSCQSTLAHDGSRHSRAIDGAVHPATYNSTTERRPT